MTINKKWILAIGVGILFCVYAFFNPEASRWMPKCPVHMLTGFDCPGCGSQRAIHAILHGDIAGAFGYNALLFFLIPFLALLCFAELKQTKHPRLFKVLYHPAVIMAVVVLICLWGVFRNIFDL